MQIFDDNGGSQDLSFYRSGNRWIFSDGTTLPIISGGDGELDSTEQDPSQGVESEPPDPYEGLSGAGKAFVENLPDDERETAIKYVKQWDPHVNDWQRRTKSEYEAQVQPYLQLGNPDEVVKAVQLAQWAQRDPNGFVNALQEAGLYKPTAPQGQQQTPEIPEELAPILKTYDERLAKLDQFEKVFPQITQWVQQQQTLQAQREQEAEIQRTLEALKPQSKHWNENGVTAMLATGAFKDPRDAVKAWDNLVQERINEAIKASSQAPPVLGSQGAPPVGNKNISEMSSNEITSYVADILQKSQGS